MNYNEWKAEVVKKLALMGMSRAELSERIDYSANYVNHVLCGDMRGKKVVKAISDYLGIEPYQE